MRWFLALIVCLNTLLSAGAAQDDPQSAGTTNPKQVDSYDIVLHSRSLVEQRKALTAIIHDPQSYIPQVQRSLRDYPRLLRTDPVAANRAVYISALVRDPSFPLLLVKNIGNETVLEECDYPCPVVFALTVQASFGGWRLPQNLDSNLTTVHDLQSAIRFVSRLSLKVGSIEDVAQGPWVEEHRKEIKGKTEEELIRMAGPNTKSMDTRLIALYRLQTLVSDSRNRIELYLLALNEVRDASGDYRSSLYQAIYRSELAKTRSDSVSWAHWPLAINPMALTDPGTPLDPERGRRCDAQSIPSPRRVTKSAPRLMLYGTASRRTVWIREHWWLVSALLW